MVSLLVLIQLNRVNSYSVFKIEVDTIEDIIELNAVSKKSKCYNFTKILYGY